METTATINSMARGMGGELLLTLSLAPNYIEELSRIKDEKLSVKIDKHRNRRSTNANAYAWLLINKIAEKMYPPMSKEEVYKEMLKRYGQGTMISVQTDRVPDVERELDYFETHGYGKVNGREFTHLKMWVGSSKYSSHEMWVFLQGIKSEAEELGIETLTPDELSRMLGEWNV
jgi:hypothetical protein